MGNEIQQDIWDLLMKAAVTENCLDEMRDDPSDEELRKLPVPARYDAKMRRFIRHYKYQEKARAVLKTARKTASAILIVFGIGFALLLSFKEVRAACQTVIVGVYKKYIEFHLVSDKETGGGPVEFGYVPNGFSFVQNGHNEWGGTILYENAAGNKIELDIFTQKFTLQMDHEHFRITNVQINNLQGKFFEASEKSFDNYLVWDAGNGFFVLSSSLGESEMVKIAEHLK